jgi:hypothetical protein
MNNIYENELNLTMVGGIMAPITLSQGARRWRLSAMPHVVRCCVLRRVFGFNYKIIINV